MMNQDSQSPPPSPSGGGDSAGEPAAKLPATVEEHGRWTALRLEEASLMDPGVIEALGAHVDHLLGQGRVRLIIDFEQVQYISSSMVGVLVGARQSVAKAGGELILAGLNRRLHELLRITRLEKMFTVEPDLATALGRARAE